MELKQLKYFIEVAEREHVSEAAMHLHVAQSAISRQISNLEKELDVQLFEREGRSIKLLPIGKVLLNHAKEVMSILDQAERKILEYREPEKGLIKIGFPTSLATSLLPQLIHAFNQSYPNITFQLRQGSYYFLVDAVKQRELDIAFLGPVITDDSDIKGDILFEEELHALLPYNHSLIGREDISLSELKEEAFILFPKGYILEKLVVEACEKEGFTPHVSTKGEDLDAIKGMVSAGMGITLLPESALHNQQNEFIKQIAIHSPFLKRNVGMITPQNRELGPSEKVFYQFVLNYFK
jgi:LysR family transcriptional activator of glutamate synthase operon